MGTRNAAGKLQTNSEYGQYSFTNLSNSIANNMGYGFNKKTYKNITDATNAKGRALTKEEFKSLKNGLGFKFETGYTDYSVDKVYNAYLDFVDENQDAFGFDSNGNASNSLQDQMSDFYSMLEGYDQSIQDNLMLDANGALAQEYKRDQYGALDQYASDLEASLASSEMSAYQQIGQQQLELENTIAEQRMKALKSGTTSAQLAAQTLQNMFSAQSGAAQVASNYMSSRLQNYNTIAQQRYGITQDLYNQINTNRQTYANAKAQLAATAGSYAATVDQPYAQYNAYTSLSKNDQKNLQASYTYTGKINN